MALSDWCGGEKWSFIVDTDSYAGNFERALCAYVIGTVDEYGGHLAGPYLAMYNKSCPIPMEATLSDTRVTDPGDDGIFRSPCDIAPTPQRPLESGGEVDPIYNSVAIFLQRKPTEEELAELVKRALEFPALAKLHAREDPRPKILGCRLVKETIILEAISVWSPEQ